MSEAVDQVVVGAGIAGLSHAWWSAARGEQVVVLEASDRVGGVIRTFTTRGYRHERAATSVPSGARHLRGLLDALPDAPELRPAAQAAQRQFLLRRGGLEPVPRSPPALLRTPLLPGGSKVRVFAELLRGPRRVRCGETLHAFVRRRFGLAVAEAFLRPFTRGIHGAAPERLGAADAFPALVAMERRRGSVLRALIAERSGGPRSILLPAGGTEAIPRALAAALGPRVRLRARVAALEPGSETQPARVVLEDGSRLEARREVTLAVRADAQAALLRASHPHVADVLDAVTYVPIAVVAVGFPRAGAPPVPDAFGFLRGAGSRARILGATFNSRLQPGVAPEGCELLTVFAGGSEDPAALSLSDAALRALVLRDLEQALGGPLQPDLVHVTRWPRAIPLFAPGHRGRMAWAASEVSGARIRLHASHVTGVSLNDCCRPAAPLPAPLPDGLVRLP